MSTNLAAILWTYLQEHPIGAVFAAPLDVVFSDFDVVDPELGAEAGDTRTTPLLPGFAVSLAAAFASPI